MMLWTVSLYHPFKLPHQKQGIRWFATQWTHEAPYGPSMNTIMSMMPMDPLVRIILNPLRSFQHRRKATHWPSMDIILLPPTLISNLSPLRTESSGSSNMAPTSFALDETTSTRPRKRKTRQTSDDLSSFVAPSMRKRRRPNAADDYRPGKFGPYTLANTSATIMTMAVHDPKPVGTSSRRTHDPNGNPLRMRRFRSTCVRSCDWTDQLFGLFIEVDKIRIEDRLWFWHGVEAKRALPIRGLSGRRDDDVFEPSHRRGPLLYVLSMPILQEAVVEDRFFGSASEGMQIIAC
ncbi:hypothetical protein BDR06DRAFT_1021209 [Suillus hirtellus]|nr:hypothetical protein BDR06DRAFT_1021209 [Suillus hirtellus]